MRSVNIDTTGATLLIELGTEELPPKALKTLSSAFTRELLAGLLEAQLLSEVDARQAISFATPRRLALSVENVISAQPDQSIERRGPAIQAAFNDAGEATPAALGFAKSCRVDVAQLDRLKTDKGEWLSYNIVEPGKKLAQLVQGIIDQAIKRLPIAKRMRWGSGTAEFVRPVKWLIVMVGGDLIPTGVLGVDASNTTRGHRFHCVTELSYGALQIASAQQYESTLLEKGHVVADFQKRQAMIVEQIGTLAASIGGNITDDQALLDEVTGLVEYPYGVLGEFDPSFLEVPQECLISSMRDHQKYFHVVDSSGKLMPNFITVSNIKSKNPQQVREGNEKVLRARLSDAQFFWETDQKLKLIDRIDRLDSVLFHQKLGSVLDKTKRLQSLAGMLAESMAGSKQLAERGALLAKADLVSDMVNEFDELQGIMGHYYADREGEPGVVGECIEQHYWPKFAGDQLPVSIEAQAVALADKLDSLVGIFASGEVPTGDKDPYGLRRAALSILRILIEKNHPFGLSALVAKSAAVYSDLQGIEIDSATQSQIVGFIRGRLTAFYQAQDIATNSINAVLACEPDSPLDFENRVKAVHAFGDMTEAGDLAAANKRISNILKKQDSQPSTEVDQSVLVEKAEIDLFSAISGIEEDCVRLFNAGDYAQGLQKLATLRSPVDAFFEHVMVMSDDKAQQHNRLALLTRLQQLFMQVADISLLQS
ncbi:MAG: glycyl-tRNA synthetase beta chain [Cryomorphaceae bacterium]|jgi:glycyl-tRNA synthetase beta chain